MITTIKETFDDILASAVCAWLRWRYGKVGSLMPPLGYNPRHDRKPLWWVALHGTKRLVWKAECALFERYGQEMRDDWERSMVQAAKETPA